MSEEMDVLRRFLDEQKWTYEVVNETKVRGVVNSDCGRWTWMAGVEEERGLMQFYISVPVNVPTAKRLMAAEYLTRANWGFRLGHFEMDWSDGEVRFQNTLVLESQRPPAANQLEHLVFASCWAIDHYMHGLMAVIYGKVSPKRALAEADGTKAQKKHEVAPESHPTPNSLRRFTPGAN